MKLTFNGITGIATDEYGSDTISQCASASAKQMRHIVKCVNLHNELVAALQDALDDHISDDGCDCHEKITALLARAKQ